MRSARIQRAMTTDVRDERPPITWALARNLPSGADSANGGTMPARFQIAQADAVSWLRSLPAASADLVITDPPYESLEKHRAIGTTTRLEHSKASSNDWFAIFPNARFRELFEAVYRALKKNAHFYLFCDPETMFVAKPIAEAAGFKFWKPLIWDKRKIGMGYHYRARYECILFFEKGKRKLVDLGVAGHHRSAARPRGLSDGEARRRSGCPRAAEQPARRRHRRPVRGIRRVRRRGGPIRATVRGRRRQREGLPGRIRTAGQGRWTTRPPVSWLP